MISSLYIHIPVCLRKCDYCDFFSVPADSFPAATGNRFSALVDSLITELRLKEARHHVDSWKTVYIGGGTPSLLSPVSIQRLGEAVGYRFAPAVFSTAEWTIEANPEDLTASWLDACEAAGINRLSLGIQSMHDPVLSSVGRRGSRASNVDALRLVRKRWRGQLSLDLIAGLPGESAEMLVENLEMLHDYGPDHISLYSLTIEGNTPLGLRLEGPDPPELPGDSEADDIWLAGRDWLEGAGYRQYEISNFARPGKECRHNRTYWELESYIGIGPGATGTIIEGDTSCRSTNTTDIRAWLADPGNTAEIEHVGREESIREFLMMGFRLAEGIPRERFQQRFGVDLLSLIGDTAGRWSRNGLLDIGEERISLTRDGLLLLNRFLIDCLQELG
jgi:putative oxygen-independent coproporphyrinogen III oxidase